MAEVFLDIHGSLPRLRRWVAYIQAGLGDDGHVRHELDGTGDDDRTHSQRVYVQVFGAESEAEALARVRPFLRGWESHDDGPPVLLSGTTGWIWTTPSPETLRLRGS